VSRTTIDRLNHNYYFEEGADKGEMVVLRRPSSGVKRDKDERGGNIFHSRYTV